MQAPGRVFLLVTGIMYIVSGSVDIIGGLLLDGVAQAVGGLGSAFGVQRAGAGIGGFAFFSVLHGAYNLVIGIMGVSNRDNFEKSGTLMNLGIISIITSLILHFVFGTLSMTTVLFLAIPICYIIGARKNKLAGETSFRPKSTVYEQRDYGASDPMLSCPPLPLYTQTEAPPAEESPAPVFPERPVAPRRQTISSEQGFFKAQVGLFKDPAKAQAYIARLKSMGFNPMLELLHSPQHGEIARVSIPGIRAAERQEVAQRLAKAGFKGTWVRG